MYQRTGTFLNALFQGFVQFFQFSFRLPLGGDVTGDTGDADDFPLRSLMGDNVNEA